MNIDKKERLFELFADQTVFDLSKAELMELKQLKSEFPDWENDLSFELTAAAISLVNLDIGKSLPANLRSKILARFEFNKKSKMRSNRNGNLIIFGNEH